MCVCLIQPAIRAQPGVSIGRHIPLMLNSSFYTSVKVESKPEVSFITALSSLPTEEPGLGISGVFLPLTGVC